MQNIETYIYVNQFKGINRSSIPHEPLSTINDLDLAFMDEFMQKFKLDDCLEL